MPFALSWQHCFRISSLFILSRLRISSCRLCKSSRQCNAMHFALFFRRCENWNVIFNEFKCRKWRDFCPGEVMWLWITILKPQLVNLALVYISTCCSRVLHVVTTRANLFRTAVHHFMVHFSLFVHSILVAYSLH